MIAIQYLCLVINILIEYNISADMSLKLASFKAFCWNEALKCMIFKYYNKKYHGLYGLPQ